MSSNYDFEARLEALATQVNKGFNDIGARIIAVEARVNRIELNLARLAEHLNFELPYPPIETPDERERRG
jgi:hypothetical protein